MAIGEAVRFRFAVGKGNSLWRHKRPGGNAQYHARPEVLNAEPNYIARALQTLTILPVFRRQGLRACSKLAMPLPLNRWTQSYATVKCLSG
jgi:hypothetical protein